jgi:hypothetical protein
LPNNGHEERRGHAGWNESLPARTDHDLRRWLPADEVSVHGGYWRFDFGGSYGRTFGITLLPLLFGIGILFFDGKSFAGRFLTGAGALFILAGIIANMDIHYRQTSLFNTIVMLVLLVGGVGLVVRSVLPMERGTDRRRDPDED